MAGVAKAHFDISDSVGSNLMHRCSDAYINYLVEKDSAIAGLTNDAMETLGCGACRLDRHLLTKPIINDEVIADLVVSVTLWQEYCTQNIQSGAHFESSHTSMNVKRFASVALVVNAESENGF